MFEINVWHNSVYAIGWEWRQFPGDLQKLIRRYWCMEREIDKGKWVRRKIKKADPNGVLSIEIVIPNLDIIWSVNIVKGNMRRVI